ncbi:MAG: hypothetical protein GKR90_09705 [Pseudomonadales bacterium]|nr:hypothetical protein [Pseudomonadales bacterium]
MTSTQVRAQTYSFDQFDLDLAAFTLRSPEGEVSVEPQVMTLLGYFVQHCDVLVTKDELLDELWGHRFVSESAVSTQIKALRRALGDDGRNQRFIKTVHGRGYRFVVPVTVGGTTNTTLTATPASSPIRSSNLGYERTKLIGRDAELSRCIVEFEKYRLVSLLGIGGTGKTRLAKAVGRAVQDRYPDGVWFIDLVPVRDGTGVDTAMASAMGVGVQGSESRSEIANVVRDSKVLFILDNCEHIEDEVAAALDFYLEHTEAPDFLVTSRDPIDLADELRFFLDPLPVESDEGPSAAVELFNLTAQRHGLPGDVLDPELVRKICTRLDGLPLAIELAAAQLKQLTLDELADRLDRRFELLAGRQREGSHRQESLIRVVENTWQLLDEEEQRLLGQLAVFPGQFTIADIEDVFDGELPNGISFAMSRLVELCLLSRTSRPGAWWRLLETVRLFALEKLSVDLRQENALRHAEWCLRSLGDYPEDHLHSFAQAKWCSEHYADITTAELYFETIDRNRDAIDVCCAVGLMIQLDDGARAMAKLKRVEYYINSTEDRFILSKLHGTAALCAQVSRNPRLLAEHAAINLDMCREFGEPTRVSGALILTSLTNNFTNPSLAKEQLVEAVQIAETSGHEPTQDLVQIYQIWTRVIATEYDDAVTLAEQLIARKGDIADGIDNPSYNATCALIASRVFTAPAEAFSWANKLLQHPEAHSLWGATMLLASALATEDPLRAVQLCLEVETRLKRAGLSPWPDLLIPAIVIANRQGDTERAGRWLSAVKFARSPQQTFHTIALYRQLLDIVKLPREEVEDGLDAIGHEALSWLLEIDTNPT